MVSCDDSAFDREEEDSIDGVNDETRDTELLQGAPPGFAKAREV